MTLPAGVEVAIRVRAMQVSPVFLCRYYAAYIRLRRARPEMFEEVRRRLASAVAEAKGAGYVNRGVDITLRWYDDESIEAGRRAPPKTRTKAR